MSRIGRLKIAVPPGVKVEIQPRGILVEGPLGKLEQENFSDITVSLDAQGSVEVIRQGNSGDSRAKHGLLRSLLFNMIRGVSQGFSRVLVVNGVGYKVEKRGENILLFLGYSTNVEYVMDPLLRAQVEDGNRIVITGADKQRVGQVAAEIRSIGPVEPYKGKKIRYADERVRRKVGKSGVKK